VANSHSQFIEDMNMHDALIPDPVNHNTGQLHDVSNGMDLQWWLDSTPVHRLDRAVIDVNIS